MPITGIEYWQVVADNWSVQEHAFTTVGIQRDNGQVLEIPMFTLVQSDS